MNKSVVEQPESLVDEESDKPFNGERFQRANGLANAANPSSHFSRRVDVVRLHVQRELLLSLQVELDHGVRQWVGVGAKVRNEPQHRAAEGSVDLESFKNICLNNRKTAA